MRETSLAAWLRWHLGRGGHQRAAASPRDRPKVTRNRNRHWYLLRMDCALIQFLFAGFLGGNGEDQRAIFPLLNWIV